MDCPAWVPTVRQPSNALGCALLAAAFVVPKQRLTFLKCAYRAIMN